MKILFFFFFLFMGFQLRAQPDTVYLMKPTGPHPVGTITYLWEDPSRELSITNHTEDKRTVIVQLWYPARIDSQNILAPYAPLSKDYQNVITNSYLRAAFSIDVVFSNLIILSPGRGTERYLYTAIAEELASHGYTVASVDMPEIGYVIYPDGLIIKPALAFKPPPGMMAGPYEKVDSFFDKPTQIGSMDLDFVLRKISELNDNDLHQRFTGKINLAAIGLLGHSLGGRIAGKFTAEHKQVHAYLSMEGIPPRAIRYQGMIEIPQVMLCSSGTWPYAKENYQSLIDHRSAPVYMIELPEFGHNSITDNPFIYPDQFNYAINPKLSVEILRAITNGYFDSQLKQISNFESAIGNIDQIKVSIYK